VGWQLDGLADGVHEPTQKDLGEVQDPSFTSLDSERGSLNLSADDVGALSTSSMACMSARRTVRRRLSGRRR
jgi:hypothetical protein